MQMLKVNTLVFKILPVAECDPEAMWAPMVVLAKAAVMPYAFREYAYPCMALYTIGMRLTRESSASRTIILRMN